MTRTGRPVDAAMRCRPVRNRLAAVAMGITLLELPGVMVSVGLPASPYPKHNLPPDPWGQPFLYESRGEHGEVDITSVGSDGKPGGTGDGADVNSRDTGT